MAEQWQYRIRKKFKVWIDCEHPSNYTDESCEYRIKPTHGGKRKGSGRPKGEPTKTIRVPVSKLELLNQLIK